MSVRFPRVSPGEPLRPRADQWNAFSRAAEAFENTATAPASPSLGAGGGAVVECIIENTTESLVPRFGVLGIDGPIIDPANSQAGYESRLAFAGVAPLAGTHDTRFVITLEPLPAGAIGRAMLAGAGFANVNIIAVGDSRAAITDDDSGKLTSGTSGPVEILWAPDETGEAIAAVRWSASGGEAVDAQITALSNDYLMVKRLDAAGTVTGEAFPAAKPEELRHTAAVTDETVTWSTVDSNTANVTLGGDTYEAKVTPKGWAVDEVISIQRREHTGLTVGDAPVVWEVDPGKRHWAAPLEAV